MINKNEIQNKKIKMKLEQIKVRQMKTKPYKIKKSVKVKQSKSKLKIAILTQGFRLNVAEAANITIRMLAEYLTEQGHEVTIFCNQIWGQPLEEKIKFKASKSNSKNENRTKNKDGKISKSSRHSYTLIRQQSNYDSRISANMQLFDFSKMIKKEVQDSGKDFDIIHNFSASPVLAIRSLLARRQSRNSKVVQTIKAKSHYFILNSFTYLLNFCDSVTVPTNFLKKDLLKWGLKSSKVKIVPSYINIEKFKPQNKDKIKNKYGYKSNSKILLYYGHLSEKKGISYLINAIEILKKQNNSKLHFTTLLVTGSGESYITPYENIIKEKKLEKEIKIIRTVANIEDYVNLADLVVLPYPDLTSTEAQPSCVLETMSSKTPLLTTEIEELKELVNSKEVHFAKPKNSENLARNILKIINLKKNAKTNRMLELAYNKALKFDKKKVLKEYEKIYLDLVE